MPEHTILVSRNSGSGGYGQGVAPHVATQFSGVVGHTKEFRPPHPSSFHHTSRTRMRRADPIEHARLFDPAIWKSTGQAFQRVFDKASTSLRAFPGMSTNTKVKPLNSSGYVTSYPQAGYWDGYRNVTPAEHLRPQDLRKMKYKDPSGFFDLIRKGKNQTTYSNFTYLGAKVNDRKYYWTTKTAAALY